MSFDIEVIAKFLSALITVAFGAIIKRYFEAKPRLISYLVHASAIPLKDSNNTQINTHSIVVRNTGKQAAHNVRIGHNFLPKSFQISPPVSHTVLSGPNGADEIVIPTIVPNEQITISYLYFPPLTFNEINAYTKSDEGLAQIINVIPTPQPSKLVAFAFWLMVFLGASTVAYWVILYAWRIIAQGS